jgi:negative regulator of flagellin synthesis FlgM
MKITGKPPLINLEAYIKNAKDKRVNETFTSEVRQESLKTDNVVLSPKAKEIQQAKILLGSFTDVREDKVAQIKKKIEQGTYQVEPQKLAEKLVTDHLLDELL